MTTPDTFEQHLTHELDNSIDTLSPEIEQRLAAARKMALQASKQTQIERPARLDWLSKLSWSWSKTAYTGAFSALLLTTMLLPDFKSDIPSTSDNELLLLAQFAQISDEEAELIEDLQFAIWLLDHDLDSNSG